MNKLFTRIMASVAGFAMAIGVGVGIAVSNKETKPVYADDSVFTIDLTSKSLANATSYQTNQTTSNYDGGDAVATLKWSNLNPNSGQVKGNQSTQNNNFWLYNDTALQGNVRSITLSGISGTYTASKIYAATSSSSALSTRSTSSSTAGTNGSSSVSWSFTGTSGGYFAVFATNGFTSGTVTATTITVTYAPSQQQGPVALADPAPQYNDLNKTVSWTSDVHAEKYQIKVDTGDYEDINTATYDASGLSVDNEHTVYIKAVGDGTNYSSTEGSVTFTPTAPFVGKDYVLCTSTSDLEVGASYLIASGTSGSVYAMSNAETAAYRPLTNVAVSDSRITTTSSVLTLTLGGSEGAWTFLTENYKGTDGYLASAISGSSDNHCRVVEDAQTGTISFNNSHQAVINLGPHASRTELRYNSQSTRFACYSSGQAAVYLWKEYKELSNSLTVVGEPNKTSYYDSETFDPTGITSYTANYSDGSSKVLSASDITWPSLTAGMTVIKGYYEENSVKAYTPEYTISVAADTLSTLTLSGTMGASYYLDDSWDQGTLAVVAHYASGSSNDVTDEATIAYYSDSEMNNAVATPEDLGVGQNQTIYVKATYETVSNAVGYAQTVSVSVEPGTVRNNPLTVEAAVAIGNGLEHNAETNKSYYIQGLVSEIVTNELNEQNKRATFWLKNGETDRGFEVYLITPDNECTNYNDFKVGAEVLILCKIKRYNSIIETGSAKSLLSITYTAPTPTAVTLNKSSLNLEIGATFTLVASLEPLGAEGQITWLSEDDFIASVSDSGVITANSAGSTTITAKYSEEIKAECVVTVETPTRSMNRTIFTADLTSTASVDNDDLSITFEAEKKSGYYQDGSGSERYFLVKGTSPLFGFEPNELIFTAVLGGGSVKDALTNNVEVSLVDNNDTVIESTKTIVTSSISSQNGEEYVVTIPYSENAYGVKLSHIKETGYNVRYYSFSLSCNLGTSRAVLSGNETNNGNSVTVDSVKMTFGVSVPTSVWNGVGTIEDYGVMMYKTTKALNAIAENSIQQRVRNGQAVSNFHKGSGEATPDGDVYNFSAYVSFPDSTKYNVVVCAAPYIVVDGTYYFFDEMHYSVNLLAQYHLANGGSNLSDAALNVLAGN